MEDNGDDPFHSLIPLCHVSSSQEELLQRCPFALEPYNPGTPSPPPSPSSEADGGDGIPITATPIRMVSLSESEEGEEKTAENPSRDDQFLTPLEEAAVSSSGDFRPAADAFGYDSGVDSVAEALVADLSLDTGLEFSKVEAVERKSPNSREENLDSSRFVSQRQNLDPEGNPNQFDSEVEMTQRENPDSKSNEFRVLTQGLPQKTGLGESPLKKPKLSDQSSGGDEERLSTGEFMEAMNNTETVASRLPNSVMGLPENNVDKGRDDEVTIFDVLKLLANGHEDDCSSCSFLEISKRRGMNFPRPTWWPRDGDADIGR